MKKISLIIVAALAFAFVACAPKQISTKVLCYNTHNCVGLDGEFSCERIAKIISEVDADAVAVQELDSMTTRHPGVDVLSELAKHTGMHAVYAPTTLYDLEYNFRLYERHLAGEISEADFQKKYKF